MWLHGLLMGRVVDRPRGGSPAPGLYVFPGILASQLPAATAKSAHRGGRLPGAMAEDLRIGLARHDAGQAVLGTAVTLHDDLQVGLGVVDRTKAAGAGFLHATRQELPLRSPVFDVEGVGGFSCDQFRVHVAPRPPAQAGKQESGAHPEALGPPGSAWPAADCSPGPEPGLCAR
jgi:hypothetical protein